MTLHDLEPKTLQQVMDLFAAGRVSVETARAYCAMWSAGPRFTKAVVAGNDEDGYWIVQRDKE